MLGLDQILTPVTSLHAFSAPDRIYIIHFALGFTCFCFQTLFARVTPRVLGRIRIVVLLACSLPSAICLRLCFGESSEPNDHSSVCVFASQDMLVRAAWLEVFLLVGFGRRVAHVAGLFVFHDPTWVR